MCEDREKDVRSHRLKPEPDRAYTAEEGRTDAKANRAYTVDSESVFVPPDVQGGWNRAHR